jgi:cysteine-rich repeat protein
MWRAGLLVAMLLASARAHAAPAWLTEHVDAPGTTADGAAAERAARGYLAQHLARLAPGNAPSDFVLLANHVDHRGLRTVSLAQRWRGMRVVDERGIEAAVTFMFGRDRLFAIRTRAVPNIAPPPARSLPAGDRAVVATGGRYAIAVARETFAATEYIDESGQVVARRAKIMFATGTLEYNAGIRYGGGARTTYAAPYAGLIVNGGNVTTASNGSFTWAGTSSSTVVASVAGTYVRVINTGAASAVQTFTLAPGATAVWDAGSDELVDAQVSAYIYANIAKARARIVNPAVLSYLDGRTDFHVNELGPCNAYSTGDDVHLFRGNAQCENTARVGDVVFHEFGHSLHAQSIISGIGAFDEHLSEGLADYFASNITGDPAMGRGFFKSEAPLRDIDPPGYERVYPQDMDFDPHVSGLIIGGALWDLRKALIADLGAQAGIAQAEQIFTGIMQRADSIGATFTAALIADDDDANLANGTPHYCAIETTFGRHGLVSDLATTSVSPPAITDRTIRMHVTTPTGTACPPLGISSITVTWKANDGVASELSLTQAGDDWTGEFPAQPDGTLITYTADVTYSDGSLASFPNNPADPRYQLYIGDVTPLWCESFDTAPEWSETSNLGPEWRWGPRTTDPTTLDPDAAFTGDAAFGTDGGAQGSYRPNLSTTISTPVLAIPVFEYVRLQYRRWLTVEDGAYDTATIVANGTEIWRNASAQNGSLDHVDREWRFHDIDLTPWIGDGAVQLEWKLETDSSKELGGWTLDDVCVIGAVKIPYCGDNVVDVGEQCDDGNRESDDGCTATCIDEVTAGGGGACSAGGNGSGSWLLALLAALWLRWPVGRVRAASPHLRRRASSFVPSRSVSARIP